MSQRGIEAADRLSFRVFVHVAESDGEISPKEVDVYLRMLRKPSWATSSYLRQRAPVAADQYSALWKQHRADGGRDLTGLREALAAVRPLLADGEAEALYADLGTLATGVARASGGFVGIGAVSDQERAAIAEVAELAGEALLAEQQPRPSMRDQAAAMALAATVPAEPARHREAQPAVWHKGPLVVRCVRIFEEARDTRTFRFVGKTPVQFRYVAGQSAVLEVEIEGKKVYRSYTIASSPSRPDCLELTIKRVPGGLVSNWMHDQLREGDEVVISGPAGKFSCVFQRPDKILMLSGGSGITPVMSMTRWLYDTGTPADVVFLHSARTIDDLIFRGELELIARRHPAFRLIFTLTREPPEGWAGCTGRICAELLAEQVPDFMDRTVYLCGPEPFMEATRAMLEQVGFPMAQYHAESFGGRPKSPARGVRSSTHSKLMELWPTPAGGVDASMVPAAALEARAARNRARAKQPGPALVFADSGHEVEVDGDATILEAADEVGVSIPNACRSGVCGTCKVRVISGEVEMSNRDGLEDHEAEMGYVLACVTNCRGKVEVEA